MKKAFGILVTLILWVHVLFAQVKFTATASKTSVAVGERFELDFSVTANAEQFTPPDLSAFQVLAGPNMFTNQMVNKVDTTFNITYNYILVAKKEGIFDIGAAGIVVNTQSLLSDSLKITVKGQFPPGRQQQIAIPDPAAVDSSRDVPVNIKTLPKQIFIKVEADKTHADVGDSINVTYKLYTRLSMKQWRLNKAPALKGLRNQGVAKDNSEMPAPTTESVNGNRYTVFIIKQLVVSPEYPGNLTIAPLTMSTILEIPDKGAFDNPAGNYHQLKYELKSAPVFIHAIARRIK